MGLLAVFDTFLVYKIADRWYGNKIDSGCIYIVCGYAAGLAITKNIIGFNYAVTYSNVNLFYGLIRKEEFYV